jgi:hypothetical protein
LDRETRQLVCQLDIYFFLDRLAEDVLRIHNVLGIRDSAFANRRTTVGSILKKETLIDRINQTEAKLTKVDSRAAKGHLKIRKSMKNGFGATNRKLMKLKSAPEPVKESRLKNLEDLLEYAKDLDQFAASNDSSLISESYRNELADSYVTDSDDSYGINKRKPPVLKSKTSSNKSREIKTIIKRKDNASMISDQILEEGPLPVVDNDLGSPQINPVKEIPPVTRWDIDYAELTGQDIEPLKLMDGLAAKLNLKSHGNLGQNTVRPQTVLKSALKEGRFNRSQVLDGAEEAKADSTAASRPSTDPLGRMKEAIPLMNPSDKIAIGKAIAQEIFMKEQEQIDEEERRMNAKKEARKNRKRTEVQTYVRKKP